MNMSDHEVSHPFEGCELFDRHEECTREMSVSSFSIEAEYIGPFKCLET